MFYEPYHSNALSLSKASRMAEGFLLLSFIPALTTYLYLTGF